MINLEQIRSQALVMNGLLEEESMTLESFGMQRNFPVDPNPLDSLTMRLQLRVKTLWLP
jgi:hypothetical protein